MLKYRFTLAAAALLLGTVALAADGDKPKLKVIPMPCIFSTPETGLAGGASLIGLGDFYPDLPDQKQDSYRAMGIFTAKKQCSVSLQAEHFSPGNGLKLDADAGFSRYPSVYYGIGGPEDDLEEDYTSVGLSLDVAAGFRLAPELYLGPYVRWSRYSMEELQSGGVLERGELEGSDGANVVLFGPRLTYEGRDSMTAAGRGYYADVSWVYSPKALGADTTFSLASVDLRAYAKPFAGFGMVVASQVFMSTATGDPPFQELPMLGGDGRLRGLYGPMYQDKTVVFGQVELRSPPVWRLGFTAFGGIGAMGSEFARVDFDEPYFVGGLGLRILLDKESGLNLRMDIAWGNGGPQMYFQLGEAF
jgi:hypothetical protein